MDIASTERIMFMWQIINIPDYVPLTREENKPMSYFCFTEYVKCWEDIINVYLKFGFILNEKNIVLMIKKCDLYSCALCGGTSRYHINIYERHLKRFIYSGVGITGKVPGGSMYISPDIY